MSVTHVLYHTYCSMSIVNLAFETNLSRWTYCLRWNCFELLSLQMRTPLWSNSQLQTKNLSLSLSLLEGDSVKKEREWGREGEWGLIRDRRGRGNTSVSLSFSGPYAIHQSKLCVSVGLREGALQCSMYYFANVFLNSLSLFLFLWQFSSCQHRPSCQFSLAAAAANRSSCFVLLTQIHRGSVLSRARTSGATTSLSRNFVEQKKEKHLFTERKERKTKDNIRTDRRTVLLAQQTIFWHVWQAPLFKCMW
jgi:hypothetical protein